MKKFCSIFTIICFICVIRGNINAQSHTLDSLRQILKIAKPDTNKVNVLNNLGWKLRVNKPDTSLILFNSALILSKKLNWKYGEMNSETLIGAIYNILGSYEDAFTHNNRVIFLCKEYLKEKSTDSLRVLKLLGRTYSNMGIIYNNLSNYPKAMEYYLNAIPIMEKNRDEINYAYTLGNLAGLYSDIEQMDKSLKFYEKALEAARKNGDKRFESKTLGNIGGHYYHMKNNSKAMEYYQMSLVMLENDKDIRQKGITLGNIASVYYDRQQYDSAAKFYNLGLKIALKTNDIIGIAKWSADLGKTYFIQKKYTEAEKLMYESLKINLESGRLHDQMTVQQYLSDLYIVTGRLVPALEHYKKYISLRDTIFSQENSKKLMRTEMDHEYEKKKAVADAEHNVQIENQKLIAAEKEKKQNIVIASVIAGLLLVLIFAGFIFRSLRITNKQKLIIEQKNAETEHQKKEIEEKQKEILDSIHYARRIQMAQIPSEKRVLTIIAKTKK